MPSPWWWRGGVVKTDATRRALRARWSALRGVDGMASIFVRAGAVALAVASTMALAGIGVAAQVPKPVPRPPHEIGAAPTPTSLDRPALLPPPSGPVQAYSYG